jgi:hypothetical protein
MELVITQNTYILFEMKLSIVTFPFVFRYIHFINPSKYDVEQVRIQYISFREFLVIQYIYRIHPSNELHIMHSMLHLQIDWCTNSSNTDVKPFMFLWLNLSFIFYDSFVVLMK